MPRWVRGRRRPRGPLPFASARRGTTPIQQTGEVRPPARARNQAREPRRRRRPPTPARDTRETGSLRRRAVNRRPGRRAGPQPCRCNRSGRPGDGPRLGGRGDGCASGLKSGSTRKNTSGTKGTAAPCPSSNPPLRCPHARRPSAATMPSPAMPQTPQGRRATPGAPPARPAARCWSGPTLWSACAASACHGSAPRGTRPVSCLPGWSRRGTRPSPAARLTRCCGYCASRPRLRGLSVRPVRTAPGSGRCRTRTSSARSKRARRGRPGPNPARSPRPCAAASTAPPREPGGDGSAGGLQRGRV